MRNSYFQFKQFIIHQEKSSMKVCTDSCLFGAWVAKTIEEKKIASKTILDIGTGTGLLSLMLAQKTNASIDAIEINQSSFEEASANFAESRWSARLHAYHADIKEYETNTQYNVIISNPPFFENDLISNDSEKNLAKHHSGLTFERLLFSVTTMLIPGGCFAVLLPFHRIEKFISIAKKSKLYLQEKILVKQSPAHSYFRGILLFSRKEMDVFPKEISIKNSDNQYSNDFIKLLSDYYLNL